MPVFDNPVLTPWAIAFDVISLTLMLIYAVDAVWGDRTNGEPPP